MSNTPNLIIRSKNYILNLSTELNKKMCGGYDCGGDEKSIDKLQDYIDLYSKEEYKRKSTITLRDCNGKIISTKGYKRCLDEEQFKCLQEKIIEIIGKHCRIKCDDLTIDRTNEPQWCLDNPRCVSYEAWNKYAKIKIRELKIELELEKQEGLVLELSLDILKPEVVVALQAIKHAQELNLSLEYNKEQSKIEFNLLLEKEPEAKIDLKTYIKLKKNNISFDIIKEVYKNNLSLEIENNIPKLRTPMGSYPAFNLDLEMFKSNYNVDIDLTKYLSDYKK